MTCSLCKPCKACHVLLELGVGVNLRKLDDVRPGDLGVNLLWELGDVPPVIALPCLMAHVAGLGVLTSVGR
jgi:hypothetical protein